MKRFLLLVCVGLLIPCTGFAQTEGGVEEKGMEYLLFEEIPTVQSAGFFKMKQTKAPGTSTILDASYISTSPARTLAELMDQNVPGFITIRHMYGVPCQGIRGMSNAERTITMLDGQNIGNDMMGYNHESLEDLPLLGDIKSVEFIKGPGAIAFGSGAIGGFMNIIPKNGTDNKGGFFNIEHGWTEESYVGEVGYGDNFGQNKDYFLYAGFVKAHGVKGDKNRWENPTATYYNGSLVYSDIGRTTNWNEGFLAKGMAYPGYKISFNGNYEDFNLKILMEESNQYFNGIVDQGGNDALITQGYHQTTHLSVFPRYTFNLTDTDSLEVMLTGQLLQEGKQMLPREGDSGNDGDTTDVYSDGRGEMTERRFGIKPVFKTTRFDKHSVAVGLSLDRKEFNADNTFFHGGTESTGNKSLERAGADMQWREFSIFGEDVIQLTDKLTASIGLRWDEVYYDGGVKAFRKNGEGNVDTDGDGIVDNYYAYSRQYTTINNYTGALYNGPAWWDPAWGNWLTSTSTFFPDDWNTSIKVEDVHNLSQRYATSYEFTENTVLKASYQEGFIVPNANCYVAWAYFSKEQELAGYGALRTLTPEKMNSTELTLHHSFENIRLMFDLTAYYNIYDNLIVYRSATASESDAADAVINYPRYNYWMGYNINIDGKFRSKGIELATTWNPIDSMVVTGSYGFSKPEDYDATVYNSFKIANGHRSQWVPYPQHMIKLNLVNKFFNDRLTTHISARWTSGLSASKAGKYISSVYKRHRLASDLAVSYQITKNWSVKMVMDNYMGSHVPPVTDDGSVYDGSAGYEKRYYYLSLRCAF